jgi:hypothetical protein
MTTEKEQEATQVKKDKELSDEQLAKASGGAGINITNQVAGGNIIDDIGTEFANNVVIKPGK